VLYPVLIIILFLFCDISQAENGTAKTTKGKHTIIFFLDNDLFGGTDQYYTNGAKLTWLFPDLDDYSDCRFLPGFVKKGAKKLPYGDRQEFKHNISLSIGQHMYTPVDIENKELIKEDRPYAGCTYLSFGLHNKTFYKMNSFILSVGMVGPSSLADKTQRFVHKVMDKIIPRGWDNQIKDEPFVQLSWEQKWRLFDRTYKYGFGSDFIPSINIMAGNAAIIGGTSGELRFGYNLPGNFGTSLNRPASGVSEQAESNNVSKSFLSDFRLYCSLGLGVNGVGRQIFLDGNSFKESHSVKKIPVVGEAGIGFTIFYKNLRATYSHIYRTQEFDKQQDKSQTYGAVNFGFSF